MPAISDLYAKIGFKVDKSGLKEFAEEMTKLKNTIAECLSGLEGFAEVAEKISKAARGMRQTVSNSDAARKLKEKQLEIQQQRVDIARQREMRLQEAAKNRGKREGLTEGVEKGSFLAVLKDLVYGKIKTLFREIGNYFKNIFMSALQAMFTYRDYRRYTNLTSAELNRWTTLAEGYATRPEIAKNMMEVQQSLLGIRLGQGNLLAAKLAGVSADTTDPFEYLNRFREAFIRNNVSPEWQKYILNQAGFGDWAVGAIRNSRNEEDFRAAFEARQMELDNQAKLAERLSSIMSLLIDSFNQLLEVLGDSVFKDALDYIRNLIIDLVNAIKGGFFKKKNFFGKVWSFGDFITSSEEERKRMLQGIENPWYNNMGIPQWNIIGGMQAGWAGLQGAVRKYTANINVGSVNEALEVEREFRGNGFEREITNEFNAEPSTQDDLYINPYENMQLEASGVDYITE